jgi:hypothetical protein
MAGGQGIEHSLEGGSEHAGGHTRRVVPEVAPVVENNLRPHLGDAQSDAES